MPNQLRQRPPALIVVLAVVALLAAITPLAYLGVRLAEFGPARVLEQLLRPRSLELLVNSLGLAAAVAASALVVGGGQAWLTVRARVPGRSLIAITAALPLAIPSYVSAYAITGLGPDFRGFGVAWLVLTASTAPYVYLAVTAALARTDTAAEDVARCLGSRRWQVFRRITWPNVRPAAISGTLLAALYALSDFGAVSIAGFDTFTRAIYNAYRSSFDRTAAASLASVLVLVALALVLAEPALRGREVPGVGGARRASLINLGWVAPIATGLALLWTGVSLGLPVASLLRWNAAGLSQADAGEVGRALLNSFGFALGGGLLATVFGLAVAILVVRYRSRGGAILSKLVWAAHAVPGLVVALGLVFLSNRLLPGVYQTTALVLFAYLVLFLPNALAAMQTPIGQAPRALDEVAASLGVKRLAVIKRVVLPLVGPGVTAGAAMMALAVLKELPATLMLRETGVETLATRLWNETSVGAYAAAAPYALLLVLLAGIPAWLLNRQVGGKS